MSKLFIAEELEDLNEVAIFLQQMCTMHRVYVINGEMGAGKTTLIGEIVKLLDVNDAPSSPTYSIVNTYYSETWGDVYHFDFYRLKDELEAMQSGLDEMIYSGNLCFIEWAQNIQNLLPENYVTVSIVRNGPNQRKITIE